MSERISFFEDQGHPMKPWPSLADKSRVFHWDRRRTVFYYDSEAVISGDGQPRAAAGKPAVVLIHGLGDEADSWRRLAAPLSAGGFRVIAPDLPGFGRSGVRGKINLDVHSDAVLALIQAAGAADRENPAVFLGSSMGALIAESAAFKRPDLAKALILMDGCFPLAGRADKNLFFMGLPFIGKKWYRAFRSNHEGAWQSLSGYYRDLDALPEEDKQFLRERVIARVESKTQERAYFASLRSLNLVGLFGGAGFSYCVKHFPRKILVVWGAEDRVLKPGAAGKIRALRPDAAYTEISGAGHLPHQEKPQETAGVILNFLKGIF
jgi:pimeloyl-ACP methyl ester carboxylesterase